MTKQAHSNYKWGLTLVWVSLLGSLAATLLSALQAPHWSNRSARLVGEEVKALGRPAAGERGVTLHKVVSIHQCRVAAVRKSTGSRVLANVTKERD